MTYDEIKARYIEAFGKAGDWSDAEWAAGCIRAARHAIEAKSIDEAVERLKRDGWGDPVDSAMRLRREKHRPKCRHCDGTGYLSAI